MKIKKAKIDKKGVFLIISGLLFLSLSVAIKVNLWKSSLEFKGDIINAQSLGLPRPVRIKIEAVRVDLSVEEGVIKDGKWQTSDDSALHLDRSKSPGEGGNIVIYAHNKNNLFGPIRWLKEGDEIKLFNEVGDEFIYKTKETELVSSDQILYVLPKERETLTLYTCSGLFDSKRFVVIAYPKDY